MCSKDDFLNWEELDLDELLGQYTDDDDFFNPDSSETCSSDDCTLPNRESASAKPRTMPVKTDVLYECPVCARQFRSVSGFRGHVMKQHPATQKAGFKGISR